MVSSIPASFHILLNTALSPKQSKQAVFYDRDILGTMMIVLQFVYESRSSTCRDMYTCSDLSKLQ